MTDKNSPVDFDTSPKISSGIITDDPTLNLPIGEAVRFRPVTVAYEASENAAWLRNWESFDGLLLSIHFREGASHSIDGSGVLVGPGIALCAKHVIEPHMQKILSGIIGTLSIGLGSHGAQIWRIRKVTMVPDTDLCILGLSSASRLPSGNEFQQAIITTRLPKRGEKLMLAGFRAGQNTFEVSDDTHVALSGNVVVCSGKVTNQFPQGRDWLLLPWPALEVECPSWGGMSGGPVFDKDGKLVGLLCRSFDQGPSSVSLIWPALTCPFEGGWPADCFRGKTTLLEMDPLICAIDNRSALQVSKDQRSATTTTVYRAWE